MDQGKWTLGERWFLVLLLVVATALRLYQLNAPLWYDEIITLINSVRLPFVDIVTKFPSNNNHVAYSALAHLSMAAFGDNAWALRLPAVLFGVGSIYLLYVFAREVAGRFEASVAALLATVSYHHIWFSQNARGYTILLFFTLLATHLLWLGMKDGKRSHFVAYAIACALAAYAHLTMVFAVVGQAAVFTLDRLIRRRGRIVLADWVNPVIGFGLAALLSIALYLPMLGDLQSFFVGEPASARPAGRSPATIGWALQETLRGLHIGVLGWWTIAAALVILITGAISYLRQSVTLAALFVAPTVPVLVATVLLHRPIFPRFFFFVAGFAILLVVRGVMVWCRIIGQCIPAIERPLPYVATAAMVLIGLTMLPPVYLPKQNYEAARDLVKAEAGPKDVIALAGIGATPIYQRYFNESWPQITSADELARLRREGHPSVWVIYALPSSMRAYDAPLLAAITDGCTVREKVPGTLGDGEIVISKCGPVPTLASSAP